MAKARKILKRANTIKAIRDVTATMEMVATARFRRAHERVVASRPFVEGLGRIVRDIAARGPLDVSHPLMRHGAQGKPQAMFVITSNRGLAGAYNAGVLRAASARLAELRQQGKQVSLRVSGKRGISAMRFRGEKLDRTFTQFDYIPDYQAVSTLADEWMDEFVSGKLAGLDVAYMQFASASRQRPVVETVLPLRAQADGAGAGPQFELSPSPRDVLENLLPLTVRMRIFQALMDAAVSEQAMRMAAMRSATENAEEMIHNLTVSYNRQRQAQITTELAEIMGGRGALEE
jgi:F-type H+-transporting ATPase subunit gamma